MKKISLALLVFLTLFSSLSFVIHASSLSYQEISAIENVSLLEGVDAFRVTAETRTDAATLGKQKVSVVKSSSSSPTQMVAWAKLGMNGIVGANVIDIAKDYEAKNPGFKVLAAINGDYYDLATKTPVNALVMNDLVIKSTNFTQPRYFSIGFDGKNVIANKTNQVESAFVLRFVDPLTKRVIQEIPVQGFNQIPTGNNTSVYYKALNEVDLVEHEVFQVSLINGINYGSTFLKGTSPQAVIRVGTLSNAFYVATANPEVKNLLKQNHQIEVYRPMSGIYTGIANIMGVGSAPLENGVIKEFDVIYDQSVDFAKARHPRSGFGWNEDGEFFLIAIDGRQTDMAGVNLREFAQIFSYYGATTAYNLDGGGSTQLAIQENNTWKMLNEPSDNPYRLVANALLLVVPDQEISLSVNVLTKTSMEVSISNKPVVGTFLDRVLYVNNQAYPIQNESFVIENLTTEVKHVSVMVTYQVGSEVYTRMFQTKRVNLSIADDDPPPVKVKPFNFQVHFEEDEGINGFQALITFDDPDKTLTKLYLVSDTLRMIALKGVNGYIVEVPNAIKNTTYSFHVEYFYRINTITPISEDTEDLFVYEFHLENDDPVDPDPVDPDPVDPDPVDPNPVDPDPSDETPNPLTWLIPLVSGSAVVVSALVFLVLRRKK